MTEDEMVGWHHRFNRQKFEQTLGGSEGQGSLACCSSWGHRESDKLRDRTTTKEPKSFSVYFLGTPDIFRVWFSL